MTEVLLSMLVAGVFIVVVSISQLEISQIIRKWRNKL